MPINNHATELCAPELETILRLEDNWTEIMRAIDEGQKSTLHCAIASVAKDGTPNITPVGTVFLRDNQTGFYFDQYTSMLAQNVEAGSSICLMSVNAGRRFWLWSLLIGRFTSPPGVRLYGTVGSLRAATPEELARVRHRVQPASRLKGSKLIWSDFAQVRDIHFTSFRPVLYPKMTEGLWK